MTTDKLGPLSVEDADSGDEEDAKRGRTRTGPATRESSKRKTAIKTVKQSPGPKSAKKTTKVKVQLRKGGKKSTENAEFQEILEEAELITASINPAEDEGEGDEDASFAVKVERDMSGDSDDDVYGDEGEYNDEELEEEMEGDYDDVTPSTSYVETGAEAESTDMSQETASSTTDTPKPAKRRKVTTKATAPPVDLEDLDAMGDLSPIKVSRRFSVYLAYFSCNGIHPQRSQFSWVHMLKKTTL